MSCANYMCGRGWWQSSAATAADRMYSLARRKGAPFFNKRARGLLQAARTFMLAVEDPNDPDNDLARGSYNITRVRQAFDFAYVQARLRGDASR